MTTRRALFRSAVSALAAVAVPSVVLAQAATPDQNVLSSQTIRDVFNSLPERERRIVQAEALTAGLYTSTVDGKFGPNTELAIRALPKWIREMSYGEVIVEADTPAKLEKFLLEVGRGEWSMWLYGEGGEGE
jgi:hypothetical protein